MRKRSIATRASDMVRRVTVSRGQFLKACGGTLLAAQIDPASLVFASRAHAATAAPSAAARSLDPLNARAADFSRHLDSTFVVGADDRLVRVRLAKVVERTQDPQLEQFSLLFHAETDAVLAEGTQRFSHPALGQFDLYIAPIGAATNRPVVLEACFNRRATKPVPLTRPHV